MRCSGPSSKGAGRKVGTLPGLGHLHPDTGCPGSSLLSSLLIPPFSVVRDGFSALMLS